MSMYVYVEGLGGLGNSLFQIFAALYYVDKYNYKIILLNNKHDGSVSVLVNGTGTTANLNGKKNTKFISYKDTIFNKFEWINHEQMTNYKTIGNSLFNSVIQETDLQYNIFIAGYGQSLDLCNRNLDLIYNHLNLQDDNIVSYIYNKYGDISNCICIGIRMGYDHPDKNILTNKYYDKALETYKEMNIDISNILIISDTNNAWNDILKLNDK